MVTLLVDITGKESGKVVLQDVESALLRAKATALQSDGERHGLPL